MPVALDRQCVKNVCNEKILVGMPFGKERGKGHKKRPGKSSFAISQTFLKRIFAISQIQPFFAISQILPPMVFSTGRLGSFAILQIFVRHSTNFRSPFYKFSFAILQIFGLKNFLQPIDFRAQKI
jgi:hypothetical protein